MKPRGFHRSDFTGGAGPGLAKLRAAKAAKGNNSPEKAPVKPPQRQSGLEGVLAAMREGCWNDAILAAAKFPDLGDHAAAIHRGREALLRPGFQRQLKRDPAQMLEEAKAALLERYGNPIGGDAS